MKTVVIILIIAALIAVVCVVYYFIRKKPKQPVEPDVPVPEVQDSPDTPDVPEEPVVPNEPEPEETDIDVYKDALDVCLGKFSSVVKVEKDGVVYKYLLALLQEASGQYCEEKSYNSIPILLKEENFPTIYNYYGEDGKIGFQTLYGWLIALVLAELLPKKRTELFKIGYEMGGYDKYSNIYGYKFDYDPNNLRVVAACIYAAMRGKCNNIDEMRKELGGTKYDKTLSELAAGERVDVGEDDFFIDLREFMPNAPGPYSPKYEKRPDSTYPDEKKDKYKNLDIDHAIYDMVVRNYNLGDKKYNQSTVQAIADKEADVHHLFGDNMAVGEYHFHPVFGEETIGVRIDPEGAISKLMEDSQAASNSARGILQSASTKPKLYGRLRPGCSWEKECAKHSEKDDRYNALCCFEIEDNDGCPTGYYNGDGKWVYPKKISSPEEFNDYFQKHLYANSYPSGHSSGIMGAALALIELMPEKADLILRAANAFACGRIITRYHWQSDVINGKVLGTAQNAVSHAAKDYDDMLNEARKELTRA